MCNLSKSWKKSSKGGTTSMVMAFEAFSKDSYRFAGPMAGEMFLIVVDAASKWVHPMSVKYYF